jgi:hypothetical protein
MDPTDLTIEILKDIRDATRATNDRIDLTNAGLGEVVERIDRLEGRQTETEVRLTTELVAVAGAVREVRDLLRDDRGAARPRRRS